MTVYVFCEDNVDRKLLRGGAFIFSTDKAQAYQNLSTSKQAIKTLKNQLAINVSALYTEINKDYNNKKYKNN